jgi:hypothetical protein
MAVNKMVVASTSAAVLMAAVAAGAIVYAGAVKPKPPADTVADTSGVKALYVKSEDTLEAAYGVVCLVPGEVVSKLIVYKGVRMVQITCTDQRQPIDSATEKAELQSHGAKFNVDAKTAQALTKFMCQDGSKVFLEYNDVQIDGKTRSTYECATGPAAPAK